MATEDRIRVKRNLKDELAAREGDRMGADKNYSRRRRLLQQDELG
jgi:hypothetical protein